MYQFPLLSSTRATGDARPLAVRLAHALGTDIARGRLARGETLPSMRAMAKSLGVHRNTVMSAYRRLADEGWIELEQGKLPRVRQSLPKLVRHEAIVAEHVAVLDENPPLGSDPKSISRGVGDVRLVPAAALGRALRRAAIHGSARHRFDYHDLRGDPSLRRSIAASLRLWRAMTTSPEEVLVTRGSQMAIDFAIRSLVKPGDRVAVEALAYPPAIAAFRRYGARLVPIPLDREGIDVRALDRASRAHRIRAIYLTPHHQYPTTATLSADRRLALISLARRVGMTIIEDDFDYEFHYDGAPVAPLASVEGAPVIYIGTLSKLVAPSLRVGYLVTASDKVDALARERKSIDGGGDTIVERAVASLFDDGEIERHARIVRRVYHARRDAFVHELRTKLEGAFDFDVPRGGLGIWARLRGQRLPRTWIERLRARDVHLASAEAYAIEPRSMSPFELGAVRFGFAPFDRPELRRVIEALVATRAPRGAPRTRTRPRDSARSPQNR